MAILQNYQLSEKGAERKVAFSPDGICRGGAQRFAGDLLAEPVGEPELLESSSCQGLDRVLRATQDLRRACHREVEVVAADERVPLT